MESSLSACLRSCSVSFRRRGRPHRRQRPPGLPVGRLRQRGLSPRRRWTSSPGLASGGKRDSPGPGSSSPPFVHGVTWASWGIWRSSSGAPDSWVAYERTPRCKRSPSSHRCSLADAPDADFALQPGGLPPPPPPRPPNVLDEPLTHPFCSARGSANSLARVRRFTSSAWTGARVTPPREAAERRPSRRRLFRLPPLHATSRAAAPARSCMVCGQPGDRC